MPNDSPERTPGLSRGGLAWAAYEVGRMPFLALVLGGVFIPYFATKVVGDPVEGQAQVAAFGTVAGVIAAVTAPIIGTSVDELGPRKPWLATATFLMAGLVAALWWIAPGGPVSIGAAVLMLVAIKVLYGYTETLHNAMLVRAADGQAVSFLSSLSMTIGNLAAILSVGFFLWAFTTPQIPLFGLERASHENVRVVGPFVALLLLASTLPLLLWTPDAPRPTKSLGRALADAAISVAKLPSTLARDRNGALYLIARMLYTDAIAALTILGGVLSAGVMKWTPTELLYAGLARTVGAVIGSMLGGGLDARLGSKRSIQLNLLAITLCMLGMIGTRPDRIAFFWPYEAAGGGGLFGSTPDLVHLALGFVLSMCIFAVTTSSRVLLIQITPPSQTGTYFGLYALSGAATAWLAPMLVQISTRTFDNQQAGIAPIIALFFIGFLLLSGVRVEPRPATAAARPPAQAPHPVAPGD